MNGLIIGNRTIPIIRDVVLTGRPPSSRPSWTTMLTYFTPVDDYELGVIVGDYDNPINAQHGPITQGIYITGGITSIDDGGELVAEIIEDSSTPYHAFSLRLHTNRNGVIDYKENATIGILPGFSGYTSYHDVGYVKLVALRYRYDGATLENEKVWGYCVLKIQKEFRYRSDGTIYTENISTGGPIVIGLPNYNRADGTFFKLEEVPIPEPDNPFEPSDEDPYPDIPPTPDTSDTINIPNNPTIGVSGAGFIHIYNPPLGYLQSLGDILFPQLSPPSDIVDAIAQLYNVIANQNLINYVIDCHVIPVTPQTGSNENIKVGYRDTGISVPKVTSDYIDATCGSLSIPEYFHGFQDYMATKSKLYLPFVGFVDTKPEYWQAGTISVDYKFNVIDGSFMCYIRSVSSKSALNGSVIAQYAGNACMHFPLTGVNYANMVSGIIGAAAGAITKGGASAVLGGAWSAANTIAQGGDVQQSNGYNSTAALLGVREAFLLIERPVPAYPAGYGHNKGFPSNITTILSGVSGYTEIEDIDLSGLPFTADEIEELRTLLSEGVYF